MFMLQLLKNDSAKTSLSVVPVEVEKRKAATFEKLSIVNVISKISTSVYSDED